MAKKVFDPNKSSVALQKEWSDEDRKTQMIQLKRRYPEIKQRELGKKMGIDQAAVSRLMKEIREEWKQERLDSYEIDIDIHLAELEKVRKECWKRLKACKNPAQGARWTEMIINALKERARLLGLNAPDKLEIDHNIITKDQRDLAFEAFSQFRAIKEQFNIPDVKIIDVKTQEPVEVPMIEGPDDDDAE